MKAGGFTPRDMIVGSKVADVLIQKFAEGKALDNRRVDLGQIDPQSLPNGVIYYGYLKDET